DGIGYEVDRLDGRMQGQIGHPILPQAIDARVLPDISTIPAVLAQIDVVDMGSATVFEDKDQLMPGSVKRPHATIVLNPNTQVLELIGGLSTSLQHLGHMPPVHAAEDNRPRHRV